MQNKTLSIFKIVTFAVILTTGLSFTYASWTDATVVPPGEGDIVELINTGSDTQEKAGNLWFIGGIKVGDTVNQVCNGSVNSNIKGTIRWNSNRLEVCEGTSFGWKELTLRRSNCTGIQNERACTVSSAPYECNCGKSGCDMCVDNNPGTQYEARFTCTELNASVTTGWTECVTP